jgi:hypothetical protein
LNSILFLFGKTIKNRILLLRRKPGLLILYGLFFAFIIYSVVYAAFSDTSHMTSMRTDILWLKLIFIAYIFLFFGPVIAMGLSTGKSIFDMSDVNFMFTAPLNPKHVLTYGLVHEAWQKLVASAFILFQATNLKNFFGIGIAGLMILFVGFLLVMLLFDVLAICIYMYTNQSAKRKNIVRAAIAVFLAPLAVSFLLAAVNTMSLQQAVFSAMSSGALWCIPFAGWITEGVFALLAGRYIPALIAAGLVAVSAALLALAIVKSKSDYYEDVLVATEAAFQKKQAAADGNITAAVSTAKARNVRSSAIKGWGARALFGRHILEASRSGPLKLISTRSLITIACLLFMAYSIRDESAYITMLITSMAMRIMLIAMEPGLMELFNHYIFLIPASSFSKIVWSNVIVALKCLVENALAFILAAFIAPASPLLVVACIVTGTLFSLVLVSVNLFSMRVLSSDISQSILFGLYFLFVILIMIPGVAGGIIIGLMLPEPFIITGAVAVIAVWEAILSAFFFYLSRGVLDKCDMGMIPKRR